MSILEKLDRSIDVLKNSDANALRSKEKAQHCAGIADAMCNPNFKTNPNFVQHISITISTLLKICNDEDSDIRMIACESLDRIIRALSTSYMAKIQLELFNAIKLCDNIRSVRTALTRFSKLSVHIKPQKGKVYVANLFPCLELLLQKPDDSLHQTFSESLPKIMKSLGHFASDKEIKSLIKIVVVVLTCESTVRRRCAAINLSTICQSNRKPEFFVGHVLNMVLDLLIPLDDSLGTHVVLGAIYGIKMLLPTYYEISKTHKVIGLDTDRFMQIFELCLYYTEQTATSPDRNNTNTVSVALDTLNALLHCVRSAELRDCLLSPGYLTKLYHQHSGAGNTDAENAENEQGGTARMSCRKATSEMSIANSVFSDDYDNRSLLNKDDESLSASIDHLSFDTRINFTDSPNSNPETAPLPTPQKSLQENISITQQQYSSKHNDGRKLVNATEFIGYVDEMSDYDKKMVSNLDTVSLKSTDHDITNVDTNEDGEYYLNNYKTLQQDISRNTSDVKNNDFEVMSTSSSSRDANRVVANPEYDASIYLKTDSKLQLSTDMIRNDDLYIGYISGNDTTPLMYCLRYLTAKFLLSGYVNRILSDSTVKVTLKVSAMNVVASAVRLYPMAMFAFLDTSKNEEFLRNFIEENDSDQVFDDIFDDKDIDDDHPLDMIPDHFGADDDDAGKTDFGFVEQRFGSSMMSDDVKSVESSSSLHDGNLEKSSEVNSVINPHIRSESVENYDPNHVKNIFTDKDATSTEEYLESAFFGDSKSDFGNVTKHRYHSKSFDSHRSVARGDSKNLANLKNKDGSKIASDFEKHQTFHDLLLYSRHEDPQLRGSVQTLLGNFISSVISHQIIVHDSSATLDYGAWLRKQSTIYHDKYNLAILCDILCEGLRDEIQTANRHSLDAIQNCLGAMIENSSDFASIRKLLKELITVSGKPYWLVKAKLCEVLSSLDYTLLHLIDGNFQNRVLHEVLYEMLADEDQRVRNASSKCLLKIIGVLYYENDFANSDGRVNVAVLREMSHKHNMAARCQDGDAVVLPAMETLIENRLCKNLMWPFSDLNRFKMAANDGMRYSNDRRSEANLTRILYDLTEFLYDISDRNRLAGVLLAIKDLLTSSDTAYKSTGHSFWFDCGIADLVQQYLQETALQLDMTSHAHMTRILTDLICAIQCKDRSADGTAAEHTVNVPGTTKPSTANTGVPSTLPLENIYTATSPADKLLSLESHILKVLNVYCHIVEEAAPVVLSQQKAVTPTTPVKKNLLSLNAGNTVVGLNIGTKFETADVRKRQFGYFANNPLYMRLYDVLKSAHGIYKTNMDDDASEKFLSLLRTLLDSLSQLLETQTRFIVGSVSEEILTHMKWTMALAPQSTIKCVEQLLKALFKTNLMWDYNNIRQYLNVPIDGTRLLRQQKSCERGVMNASGSSSIDDSNHRLGATWMSESGVEPPAKSREILLDFNFYHDIYVKSNCDNEENTDISDICKLYTGFKTFAKKRQSVWQPDKDFLSSSIRLFEPMVIESLKKYTTTSDTLIQSQVLKLLCQLLQLRVNYCMLDSESTFIEHVLKQFEYIEQGQIANSEVLIPQILYFLLHLSDERHHSKCLIAVPKILQLCDGLIASEQSQKTHCIPAIIPLVEEIFLFRNESKLLTENVDLATTREVIFAMCLRLLEFTDIQNAYSMILVLCSKQKSIYDRRSRQVLDGLLNLIQTDKLKLRDVYEKLCFKHLLKVLSQDVVYSAESLEEILKLCFDKICGVTRKNRNMDGYAAAILLLAAILRNVTEKFLLARLDCMKKSRLIPWNCVFFHENIDKINKIDSDEKNMMVDPLNVLNSRPPGALETMPSDVLFVRYCLRLLSDTLRHLTRNLRNSLGNCDSEDQERLANGVSSLMDFVKLLCKLFDADDHNNPYKTIARTARNLHRDESQGALGSLYATKENLKFHRMTREVIRVSSIGRRPALFCHWCRLLVRMDYRASGFWHEILTENDFEDFDAESNNSELPSLNRGVMRTGAFLAYCDFFNNPNGFQSDELTWLLLHHTRALLRYDREPSVSLLLRLVHESEGASALFLQTVTGRLENCIGNDSRLAHSALRHMDSLHAAQSGAILHACVARLGRHLLLSPSKRNGVGGCASSLSRRASVLCLRRAEYLRTLGGGEEVRGLLHPQDLAEIRRALAGARTGNRHGTLISTLDKLSAQFYESPSTTTTNITDSNRRPTTPPQRFSRPTERWRAAQIRLKSSCNNAISTKSETKNPSEYRAIAGLLRKLDQETLQDLVNDKQFDAAILGHCLAYQNGGAQTYDDTHEVADDDFFIKTTADCVLNKVIYLTKLMPRQHYVYCPRKRHMNQAERKYTQRCTELFGDQEFLDQLMPLTPCVINLLRHRTRYLDSKPELTGDLLKFLVLCTEFATYTVQRNDSQRRQVHETQNFELLLLCVCDLLKNCRIWKSLNDTSANAKCQTYICSAVNFLYTIIDVILTPNLDIRCKIYDFLQDICENDETQSLGACFCQIIELTQWLESSNRIKSGNTDGFGSLLSCDVTKRGIFLQIFTQICRLDLLKSYAMCPRLVFESNAADWTRTRQFKMAFGETKQQNGRRPCWQLPPLPIEFLQDYEVLESFVFRCNLYGWTCRQQFEEMWMSLLGVLSSSTTASGGGASDVTRQQHGGADDMTIMTSRLANHTVAVEALTKLLVSSLLLPQPGNPTISRYLHVPRDRPIRDGSTVVRKLNRIHKIFDRANNNDNNPYGDTTRWPPSRDGGGVSPPSPAVLPDLERLHLRRDGNTDNVYLYGQLSARYLKTACGGSVGPFRGNAGENMARSDNSSDCRIQRDEYEYDDEIDAILLHEYKEKCSKENGDIDLESCLRFIVDLYGQMLDMAQRSPSSSSLMTASSQSGNATTATAGSDTSNPTTNCSSDNTCPVADRQLTRVILKSLVGVSDLFAGTSAAASSGTTGTGTDDTGTGSVRVSDRTRSPREVEDFRSVVSTQHSWTLDTCRQMFRTVPLEDELSHQYVALLACKSAAVVLPEPEALAELRSILHSALRSVFPPARTAAAHGLMYLLDGLMAACGNPNTSSGNTNTNSAASSSLRHKDQDRGANLATLSMNDSSAQSPQRDRNRIDSNGSSSNRRRAMWRQDLNLFYEQAREYAETVFAEVEQGGYHHSLYHQLTVFALAFYLLEHFDGALQEANQQNPSILCSALFVLEQHEPNVHLYEAVTHGLERLVILDKVSKATINNIIQLTMKKIKHDNITMTLPALRLMVTCMYKGASEQLSKSENSNCAVENDLDVIVESVEKTTAIFDRIRKSNASEAKILCSVLSAILNDLFPPSEILTKIVGEFFAVNQPHTQLIAGIVFEVFQRACRYGQLELLQAWLVCSLPNFTSKLPPGISSWCLTCVFIAASDNRYLTCFFPYVCSRMGLTEREDREMLCIAARDFCENLKEPEQRRSVVDGVRLAADRCSDSGGGVFGELLESLENMDRDDEVSRDDVVVGTTIEET